MRLQFGIHLLPLICPPGRCGKSGKLGVLTPGLLAVISERRSSSNAQAVPLHPAQILNPQYPSTAIIVAGTSWVNSQLAKIVHSLRKSSINITRTPKSEGPEPFPAEHPKPNHPPRRISPQCSHFHLWFFLVEQRGVGTTSWTPAISALSIIKALQQKHLIDLHVTPIVKALIRIVLDSKSLARPVLAFVNNLHKVFISYVCRLRECQRVVHHRSSSWPPNIDNSYSQALGDNLFLKRLGKVSFHAYPCCLGV